MERQDWQNVVKEAAIKEIHDHFSLTVYGEEAPQKIKMPCFTVVQKECSQKRLLGQRREMRLTLEAVYHTEDRRTGREEAAAVADGLYDCLWIIGGSEKFCAQSMSHEVKEGKLVFQACYVWHMIWQEEEILMQRLKYNGRKVVGYEQDGEIQQGTAGGQPEVL